MELSVHKVELSVIVISVLLFPEKTDACHRGSETACSKRKRISNQLMNNGTTRVSTAVYSAVFLTFNFQFHLSQTT